MQRLRSTAPGPAAYTAAVDADDAGQRIDNFLLRVLKGVPRAHVYQLIRSGQVRVNRGRVRASYRLKDGDAVRIPPVRQAPRARPDEPVTGLAWLEQRILHEDQRILVLDKPAGMAVHGGSGIHLGCIEALRSLRPAAKGMDLVHRLDRGTSGCLIVAKRRSALRLLHGVLREGAMEKRYLALLKGNWSYGGAPVSLSLAREERGKDTRVRVSASGKAAQSEFRVVTAFGRHATLAEVSILTGRTHQIRVHAAHLGHPVAGDSKYGDTEFNRFMRDRGLQRMFLHAHAVGFEWPDTGELLMISAPLPTELGAVLEQIADRGTP